MWALELERAETTYKFRRYQPPFYSFLYSVHSQLPDFLINTHAVSDVADMRAYNARLRRHRAGAGRGHRRRAARRRPRASARRVSRSSG